MTIRKKNIDPKMLLGGPDRRDLVDVGELHYELCKAADEYEGDMIPVDVAFDLIANAPVVDAAPVVRCEKCLYRSQYANEHGMYKCGGILTADGECFLMVKPDYFCCFGVKRGKSGGDG